MEPEIVHNQATTYDKDGTLLDQINQPTSRTIGHTKQISHRKAGISKELSGPPPAPPDQTAWDNIQLVYKGGKKPPFVFNFKHQKNGVYSAKVGNFRFEIHQVSLDDEWQAWMIGQRPRWNARKKRMELRPYVMLRSRLFEYPARAMHDLCNRESWFFYEGQWRALTWLYKSIVMIGLTEKPNPMPTKTFDTYFKTDEQLHVRGRWFWQPYKGVKVSLSLREISQCNSDASRTPKMPDIRSEMLYDQVDDHGKAKKGYKFYDDRGRVTKLSKKIVRAPVEKPYNNKNPNPNRVPYENGWGMPMKEWMDNE